MEGYRERKSHKIFGTSYVFYAEIKMLEEKGKIELVVTNLIA
jgi:hypothetical protein